MIYEITPSFHAPILPSALHTLKPTNAIKVQLTNVIQKINILVSTISPAFLKNKQTKDRLCKTFLTLHSPHTSSAMNEVITISETLLAQIFYSSAYFFFWLTIFL